MGIIKLKALLSYTKGKPPRAAASRSQELPYLNPEYLRGNGQAELVPVSGSSVLVDAGDLLLLWDGSNAGEFFEARPGVLASTMVRLDFDRRRVNRDYLYYHFKRIEPFLKAQTSGSGIPHVDKDVLGNVEVTLYDKPEQELISRILKNVDDAIAQTEALIAKYGRVRAGLMQDLLTKGIDEEGRIRSEETHTFKDSPLGRIPLEWDIMPLSFYTISSAFGPRFPAGKYADNGAVALLRTTDLDDEGNISLSTMPKADLDPEKFRLHIMEPYDFLITRSGTIGIASVFEGYELPVLPGAFLIRFRLHQERLSPFYLRRYVNSEVGRIRVMGEAAGGVQKNLKGSTLLRLEIPVPPPDEQKLINERFDILDGNIRAEAAYLAKLRCLKTGLMQDLLTGKVSVDALLSEATPDAPEVVAS
jgi:type I restriction enzyme, S subunit